MTTSVDAVPGIHGGVGPARAAALVALAFRRCSSTREARKLDRTVFGDPARREPANDAA